MINDGLREEPEISRRESLIMLALHLCGLASAFVLGLGVALLVVALLR